MLRSMKAKPSVWSANPAAANPHSDAPYEFAPEYMSHTIENLPALRKKWIRLRQKEKEAQAEFDKASASEQHAKNEALRQAKRDADAAFYDIASIFGGFITVEDCQHIQDAFKSARDHSAELRKLLDERRVNENKLADAKYNLEKKGKGQKKIDSVNAKIEEIDGKIAEQRAGLAEAQAEIDKIRAGYKDDPNFQKYEVYRDDGIDLARLTKEEMRSFRSELQLIFQDPYSSLNPRMTVGQIIGEGMLAHKYFSKNSPRMQDRILEIMQMCGLAPYFIHRFPHQFSGGQRQRIGIARALSTNPKFVICDEAVSALDVSIQSQIINLLQDLKEKNNLTYLFITHDLSVVKYISDRIGVMYLGNMVELSDSQELFDHPMHPYTEALLSAIPTTNVDDNRELVVLEGDIPSPVKPPKGCKFHTRCKYCTEICKNITPEFRELRPNHFVACHHVLGLDENKTK